MAVARRCCLSTMEQSAGALADGRLAAGLDEQERSGSGGSDGEPRYRNARI
jgi:hypothetical protein